MQLRNPLDGAMLCQIWNIYLWCTLTLHRGHSPNYHGHMQTRLFFNLPMDKMNDIAVSEISLFSIY